jgi:hypothetical protein
MKIVEKAYKDALNLNKIFTYQQLNDRMNVFTELSINYRNNGDNGRADIASDVAGAIYNKIMEYYPKERTSDNIKILDEFIENIEPENMPTPCIPTPRATPQEFPPPAPQENPPPSNMPPGNMPSPVTHATFGIERGPGLTPIRHKYTKEQLEDILGLLYMTRVEDAPQMFE